MSVHTFKNDHGKFPTPHGDLVRFVQHQLLSCWLANTPNDTVTFAYQLRTQIAVCTDCPSGLCYSMNMVESVFWNNDSWKGKCVGVVPRVREQHNVGCCTLHSQTFMYSILYCYNIISDSTVMVSMQGWWWFILFYVHSICIMYTLGSWTIINVCEQQQYCPLLVYLAAHQVEVFTIIC